MEQAGLGRAAVRALSGLLSRGLRTFPLIVQRSVTMENQTLVCCSRSADDT